VSLLASLVTFLNFVAIVGGAAAASRLAA